MTRKTTALMSLRLLRILCAIFSGALVITLVLCIHFSAGNGNTKQPINSSNTSGTTDKPGLSDKNKPLEKPESGNKTARLAIIIDDLGQSRTGVKEMMSIKRPLTFAVMPFLSYSREDAVNAHKKGYEVIVHLPMQSQEVDKESWLGPDPIKVNQSYDQIERIIINSLSSVPYAVGTNIHMGVMASEDENLMVAVMSILKQKGLYFIDSRTTANTTCDEAAAEVGLEYSKRNVFLDDGTKDGEYIKKQILSAADKALENGYAVAIGHVGSMGGVETAESIREMLPELDRKGVKLVFVSEIVKTAAP